VFKPSTDAESLLGSIKKKFLGSIKKKKKKKKKKSSPGRGWQSGGVFDFWTYFDGPWTPIPWAKILAQTIFGN